MPDDLHTQERDLWGDEPDYGPPRCYCGRFVSEWGIVHPECAAAVYAAEQDTMRREVEAQGLIP